MSNDQKPAPDPKAVDGTLSDMLRDSRNRTRVNWAPPPPSADPETRRRDWADLNRAIRKAGRHAVGYPPEEGDDVA